MKIYLDNAATTKPDVSKSVFWHMEQAWYNPSAAYAPAEKVFIEIKKAKQLLADLLGYRGRVIFTSGGTEANNMAILSLFKQNAHYVTSAIEHPSVYETFRHMESLGAHVDYVKPNGFCIQPEHTAGLVRDDTALVSIMHVNNETGALNDIEKISRAVKERNPRTRIHVDGVQALFKTKIDLSHSHIDYYTVSAHKIHALKGTGALLLAENAPIGKLHYGGEQENTFRPGTENTLGIQTFCEALERGKRLFDDSLDIVAGLRKKLINGLCTLDGAHVNEPAAIVPHIVNVSFAGIRAEVLVRMLGEKGIYIGTGAACSRGKTSRVLLESGVSREEAEGAVRISMCASNTQEEIDSCIQTINGAVEHLRRFRKR